MRLWSRKPSPPEPEPEHKPIPTFVLTSREITIMTGVVADVNPSAYDEVVVSDEVKAVIYKAKTMCQRATEHGRIEVEIDAGRRWYR